MMSQNVDSSGQEVASPGRVSSPGGLTVAVVVLLAALAACGSDEDAGSATTTVPATTNTPQTTTAPATTNTTAAPQTTTAPVPRDETIFGWLRSFTGSNGTTIVGVDQAEMLTGEEAVAAAREEGVIGEDEDLPNDFYIRDPDQSTIELTVSPDVVVTLQACYQSGDCVTTEQVDLDTWSVLLGAEDDPGLEWDWYGGGSLPYRFTVESGVIVEVQEVYLP